MTRFARLVRPGVVHHIIGRIVDAEFRITSQLERDEYLCRLAGRLARSDWSLLAFALMSNHIHLSLLAGGVPPGRVIGPVHAGFARWWNRRHGRRGPFFAERFKAIVVPPARVGYLHAYLHQNPQRAGVVTRPECSTWTSHRALIGLDEPPAALDVATSLALSGFDTSEAGRAGFHAFVAAHGDAPRDPTLSEVLMPAIRVSARLALHRAVELCGPTSAAEAFAIEVDPRPSREPGHPYTDDAVVVLAIACEETGTEIASVAGQSRVRSLVRVRRAALSAWTRLGRPLSEMARAIGCSGQAASGLLARGNGDTDLVRAIVDKARNRLDPTGALVG